MFILDPIIGEMKMELNDDSLEEYSTIIIFISINEVSLLVNNKHVGIYKENEIHRCILKSYKPYYVVNFNSKILSKTIEIFFKFPKIVSFISCDYLELRNKNCLWNHIKSDTIFHIGDNIYMDIIYNKAKKNKWSYDKINEKGLKRYTKNLNPIKCYHDRSNLMLWDDHDICDGFKLEQMDNYSKPLVELYNKIQGGLLLYECQGPGKSFYRIYNRTLVYFIERVSIEKTILSYISKVINGTSNIDKCILCFTSSPVIIPDNSSYAKIFGKDGSWTCNQFIQLAELIENHKNIKFIIIGGDLHMGLYGLLNDTPIIVTSPMTNICTPIEKALGKKLKGKEFILDSKTKLKYVNYTSKRNYINVNLDTLEVEIVKEKKKTVPSIEQLVKVLYQLTYRSE